MAWALTPLTEEQREIQRVAREFAEREIAPHSDQWDRDQHFDPDVVAKMGELGFLGMMLPERYDGLGLDTLTYLVALEEIAIVDASVAVMLSVHNSLPTQMLLKWGTEEQKERFLKPMARGEMLGAFALSEPEAGSDAASLRAQAVKDGKDWVLNGAKAWATNAGTADLMMIMARTDAPNARRGAKGISTFIVPTDTKGYKPAKPEDKMGLRASNTAAIELNDVRLPADQMLGDEGMGFI